MPVILLLIDALRHDYVSKATMPFLFSLTANSEYHEHVIPSYGFCERTEILSGLTPDESGYFTAIGFEPEHSPYRASAILPLADGLLNKIPAKVKLPLINRKINIQGRARSFVGRNILKHNNSNRLNKYNIPFAFLPFFNLTEDAAESSYQNNFKSISVISKLEKSGKSAGLDAFTSLGHTKNLTDTDRMSLAVEALKNSSHELILVYNSIPDHYGHMYGPSSSKLNNKLKDLDNSLYKFISDCKSINDNTTFIILGDHGMAVVKKHIDIKSIVDKIAHSQKLHAARDFVYFLDSTMFRMWFFSEEAQKTFSLELENNTDLHTHGVTVSNELAKKLKIPFGDKRYGDYLWLANEGVLVSPDFFHPAPDNILGMHGYNPSSSNSHGTCIVYGKNVENKYSKETELKYVYTILANQLGLV